VVYFERSETFRTAHVCMFVCVCVCFTAYLIKINVY